MRNRLFSSLCGLALVLGTVAAIAQPNTATVRGIVVDAAGAPVAGATVWAVEVDDVPIDPHETKSGDNGAFELTLRPGRWKVMARAGNTVGASETPYGNVRLSESSVRENIRIPLRPGARLHGVIQDRITGEPIPHAKLWVDEGVLIESDDHGQFSHDGLTQSDHHLYAIAPGYAREVTLFDTTLREDANIIVRTAPGGTIRGTVRDAEGHPVSGAVVWRPGSGNTVALQAGMVQTGPDGKYELTGVTFYKTRSIDVIAKGFKENERGSFTVTPDVPELTADFVLQRDAASAPQAPAGVNAALKERELRSVQGVVRDGAGAPVAGATVGWITNALDAHRITTTTDANGAFRLEGLYNIQSMLMVVADGFATAFAPLEAAVTDSILVVLEPEIVIRGHVVNSLGKPIAGVKVIPNVDFSLEHMFDIKWFDELSVSTDETGAFELKRQPKTGVSFDFLRPGQSEIRKKALKTGEDTTITMLAGGAIRGKVVDAEGHPITDFRVLVQPTHQAMPGKKSGSMFAGYTGIGIRFSNADGEFVVSDLSADMTHRVVIVAEGYSDAVQDPVLSYPVDQLPDASALTLQVGPPTPLRVSAIDLAAERPVPSARVQLIDYEAEAPFDWGYTDQSWERWIETRTDAAGVGVFTATGMHKGTLVVRAPGYGRRRLAWHDAQASAEISLATEAIVQGVAADETGRVLAQGVVRLADRENNTYAASLSPEDLGRFAFRELPAGSYSLSISRDNQPLFKKEFELGVGQMYDLDIHSLAVIRLPLIGSGGVIPPPQPLEIGAGAPAFTVSRIGGGEVKSEDFRGKYVLLEFWATWCGPCRDELPYLKKTFEAYGGDARFAMISLSMDDGMQEPADYIFENKLGWIQGFLGGWAKTPVPNLYGVWGIPSIFLIGPDGKILNENLRGEGIAQAVGAALGAAN